MYNITKYSKDQAEKLGVVIKPSKKVNKKIDVFKNNELIVSIGDKRYKDYPTYIIENGLDYANERRKLYKNRHKKDAGVAGFYAKKILW
jgi:hypothetical protein